MKNRKRIGILSGGGDCPGINAVIRAVARKAMLEDDAEIIGIEDGYEGLVNNKYRKLELSDLSGILTLGGTILGASKKANPYRYAIRQGDKLTFKDMSKQALNNIEGVSVSQSFWGRIMGFGHLRIEGTGVDHVDLPTIADPIAFRAAIESAKSWPLAKPAA